MVGFQMLLDNQKEEGLTATQKVQRFKELDPPPYNGLSFPSPKVPVTSDFAAASQSSVLRPASDPSVPSPLPHPSVSQLHILQKHGPISGTFYIDPRVPDSNKKGNKGKNKNPLHASFRTRHGPISLNLGTIGDARVASDKANVSVSSRHGDINVNLLPTSPLRPTIGLEMKTRQGDIVLFVSRDFAGAVQLSSYKGRIEFLPAFASLMRVVKQTQNDALVMFGGQTIGDRRDLNYCELETRRGKVVIGLSDVDRYNPAPGFWKRLLGLS